LTLQYYITSGVKSQAKRLTFRATFDKIVADIMIKTANLTFIYSAKTKFAVRAVDNVSVEINDGDFLGVIGHTGSGKSTFVQHLNALLRAKSGEIEVCGFDLTKKKRKIDYKSLRKDVGMVFQYPEYQLFAETVKDDVAFALKNFAPKKQKPSREEIEKKVREAMGLVGLNYDEFADRSPFELSGGQKRRAALAGTLVAQPKILILDEPTAGLDPQGKKEIYALLHELRQKFVRIVIIISHDMNEIAANCNRVAVMKNGKIVYDLPPKELFLLTKDLQELNLTVPQTTKIANMLCENGIDIERNIFSAEELAESIYEKFRNR